MIDNTFDKFMEERSNENKEKCKQLRKVRKQIADELNIDLHQVECTYEGICSGTCPKCFQEEQILNIALSKQGNDIDVDKLKKMAKIEDTSYQRKVMSGKIVPEFLKKEERVKR